MAKQNYEDAMKNYKASGGGEEVGDKKKTKKNKSSPTKLMSGSGFKSKEYLSDTGSSSDDESVSINFVNN